MFTIKHIDNRIGDPNEEIYSAQSIRYLRRQEMTPASAARGECAGFHFETTHGEAKVLTMGTIYVMNADGKTVAKYDLSELMAGRFACSTQGIIGG